MRGSSPPTLISSTFPSACIGFDRSMPCASSRSSASISSSMSPRPCIGLNLPPPLVVVVVISIAHSSWDDESLVRRRSGLCVCFMPGIICILLLVMRSIGSSTTPSTSSSLFFFFNLARTGTMTAILIFSPSFTSGVAMASIESNTNTSTIAMEISNTAVELADADPAHTGGCVACGFTSNNCSRA